MRPPQEHKTKFGDSPWLTWSPVRSLSELPPPLPRCQGSKPVSSVSKGSGDGTRGCKAATRTILHFMRGTETMAERM